MKQTLLLISLFSISFSFLASSQNMKYSISDKYAINSRYKNMSLLDDHDDCMKFVTRHKKEIYLVSLKGKNRFNECRIENPFDEIEQYKSYAYKDTLITCILAKHKKKKELSLNILRFDNKGKEIDRLLLGKYKNEDYKNTPWLYLSISPDKSKFSLIVVSDEEDKSASFKIRAFVMNTSFKILNDVSYNQEMKNAQRLFSLKNFITTDSGELIILLKKYDRYRKGNKIEYVMENGQKVHNYCYEIINYPLGGLKVSCILDLRNRFIKSSNFFFTENKNPILLFNCQELPYSNDRTSGIITYVRDSASGKWKGKLKEFDDNDYYEMFLDDKNLSKNFSIRSDHVSIGDDLYILYERYFTKRKTYNTGINNTHQTEVIRVHSNAIIFKIDLQGQFSDPIFIPKYAETGRSGMGSRLVRRNDSWAFIYKNRKSNFYRSIDDYKKFDNKFATGKKTVLMTTYLDNNDLITDYIPDSEGWNYNLVQLKREKDMIRVPIFKGSLRGSSLRFVEFGL